MSISFFYQALSENILDDADLAGPLCFCAMLGGCLLMAGKVSFYLFQQFHTILLNIFLILYFLFSFNLDTYMASVCLVHLVCIQSSISCTQLDWISGDYVLFWDIVSFQ